MSTKGQAWASIESRSRINHWLISTLWDAVERKTVIKIRLADLWESDRAHALSYLEGDERRKVMEADLRYPIIVDDRMPSVIWDGYHRIAKALACGHETIDAVVLQDHEMPPPDKITFR